MNFPEMKQRSSIQDGKTFTTWWAMVKANASLISKAKENLGNWILTDEHFQAETFEATAGLARILRPEYASVTLSTKEPWLLPGLLDILQALEDVGCKCQAIWQREWTLQSKAITLGMSLLLMFSSPSTVILELADDLDSSLFDALPNFIDHLSTLSCSVSLLLEGDYLSKNGMLTSDYVLLPCLFPESKVRFRRLSCHMGTESAAQLLMEEKLAHSSEEDFPSARMPPSNPTLPVVRYLEVLKVRISSLDTITSLNDCLPYLELLQDLEVHLTLPAMTASDSIPQISFQKDCLTLRLDHISDSRAEWAGKITAAFSRLYTNIWLCSCYMTFDGGLAFLEELRVSRTLVEAIHVFSANASRPNGHQYLTLTVQAGLLAVPTTLYW